MRPLRSGTLIDVMIAPYGIVRTSTPLALVSIWVCASAAREAGGVASFVLEPEHADHNTAAASSPWRKSGCIRRCDAGLSARAAGAGNGLIAPYSITRLTGWDG